MADIPRRKLDEIAFIYERHPERRDFYVEGPFDASILRWLFKQNGIESVAVYEIGTIEVSDGEVLASNLKDNNRGRLIFLSSWLSTNIGLDSRQGTCFVDADFSYILNDFDRHPCLVFTDFACMEMYFYDPVIIEKVLTVCCDRCYWPVPEIIDTLAKTLAEFFLLRMANEILGWHMDWLDRMVCLEVDGYAIRFESNEYTARYLSKNAKRSKQQSFEQKVMELRELLRADARYQIHGHDFSKLFAWYLRQKGIRADACKSDVLHKTLALAADFETLRKHNAISLLLARADS